MDLATLWPAFDVEDEDHGEWDDPPVARMAGPGPITFPTTLLVTRVQIALGADLSADPLTWAWEDITRYVRVDLGISLTVGRRDEATQVTTGSGQMKLDNRDGRFTRRNPNGPYYGLLSKNTPIWATVDAGSGESTRMEMFVNEWPTRWSDKSATDSTVTVACAGVLRRLAQGRTLKTALRRAILASGPVAYWTLEDGSDATSGASALPSGAVMEVVADTVDWAGATPPAGATAAPDLSDFGRLLAPVPAATTSAYTVEFVANVDEISGPIIIRLLFSGGTYFSFELGTQDTVLPFVFPSTLIGYTTPSTGFQFGSMPAAAVGLWHHYRIVLKQVGGNVNAYLWLDGVEGINSAWPGTLGQLLSVAVNPANQFEQTITGSVGHVAVYNSEMLADHSDATLAFAGEMAHERIVRLCGEEGALFQTVASTSAAMGPQGSGTLTALLRECEAADGGVLYEKRWGLAYKSRIEYYNQAVSLALDFDQGHIAEVPEPADDDQRTRNLWTVSRTDGSEYPAEEATGAMGTGNQGPGVYDDAVTLNLESDNQLPQQAAWKVHQGTVDEDRWPSIDLNFAHDPSLIAAWTAFPFGGRVTVDNPLPQMPPDPLDQIVEGHSERWDPFIWTASLNCSPASPHRVVVVGSSSGNLGRVDAANSTLAADATSGATTISVASPIALWRTGAVNFDINVAGERMTVTNISGGSSPQTFTVTRSVNGVVKAQPASIAGRTVKVSLHQPAVYAL